jgi:hypothetical protein
MRHRAESSWVHRAMDGHSTALLTAPAQNSSRIGPLSEAAQAKSCPNERSSSLRKAVLCSYGEVGGRKGYFPSSHVRRTTIDERGRIAPPAAPAAAAAVPAPTPVAAVPTEPPPVAAARPTTPAELAAVSAPAAPTVLAGAAVVAGGTMAAAPPSAGGAPQCALSSDRPRWHLAPAGRCARLCR